MGNETPLLHPNGHFRVKRRTSRKMSFDKRFRSTLSWHARRCATSLHTESDFQGFCGESFAAVAGESAQLSKIDCRSFIEAEPSC